MKVNKKEIYYGLDISIAKFVLPRLIAFRRHKKNGVPGDKHIDTMRQWNLSIDNMIFSFRQIVNDYKNSPKLPDIKSITYTDKNGYTCSKLDLSKHKSRLLLSKYRLDMKAYKKKIDKGLLLFAKYFTQLYD